MAREGGSLIKGGKGNSLCLSRMKGGWALMESFYSEKGYETEGGECKAKN
jgi:hypothetical protein